MKHGPIALIDEDMPVVFIATKTSSYDKVVSNIQEELRFRTDCTYPEDIDFYKILSDNKKVKTFSEIISDIFPPEIKTALP